MAAEVTGTRPRAKAGVLGRPRRVYAHLEAIYERQGQKAVLLPTVLMALGLAFLLLTFLPLTPFSRAGFPQPYAIWLDILLLAFNSLGMLVPFAASVFLLARIVVGKIKRGENVPGCLALLVVMLAFSTLPVLHAGMRALPMQSYYVDTIRLPGTITLVPGGKGVVVDAYFGYSNLDARLERVLDAHPGVEVVYLESPGGMNDVAERLAHVIRSRGLSTYVYGWCASSCPDVLMAGRERYLKQGAMLAFHSAMGIDWRGQPVPDTRQSTYHDLIAAGLPEDFAAKAQATPHNTSWIPEVGELRRAGVITAEVEPGRFPDPEGVVPVMGTRRVHTMWTELKFLLPPRAVEEVTAWSLAQDTAGWSVEARTDILQRFAAQAFLIRLAKAPDDAVVNAGAMLLKGMQEAGADGLACARIGARADLFEALWALVRTDAGARERLHGLAKGLKEIKDGGLPDMPAPDKPLPPVVSETRACGEWMRPYAEALSLPETEAASRIRAHMEAAGVADANPDAKAHAPKLEVPEQANPKTRG